MLGGLSWDPDSTAQEVWDLCDLPALIPEQDPAGVQGPHRWLSGLWWPSQRSVRECTLGLCPPSWPQRATFGMSCRLTGAQEVLFRPGLFPAPSSKGNGHEMQVNPATPPATLEGALSQYVAVYCIRHAMRLGHRHCPLYGTCSGRFLCRSDPTRACAPVRSVSRGGCWAGAIAAGTEG